MKNWFAVVAVAFMCFFGQAAEAAIITFDDVADGTRINTNYADVTFSKLLDGADGGDIFARSSSVAGSSPNVVSVWGSTWPMFDVRYGTIHASFADLQDSVSIDVYLTDAPEGFGTTGTGYIKAYDANGNLLQTATTTSLYAWNTLSISASGIKDVYFSVITGNHPTYGLFDNLTYSNGGGDNGGDNGGGTTVPEPSSLLLLAAGLAGLALKKKYNA